MKPYARTQRVSAQIQKALADMLNKEIKDPRLELATITGVKMSRDLRIAKIYYGLTGAKKSREEVSEGFKQARGYIKRALAGRLGLRYMPDLRFYYDESFDYGSRINRILESIVSEDEPDHSAAEK